MKRLMRIGGLIAAAVAVMAAAVLFVGETGRSATDRDAAKLRVAAELRDAALTEELATQRHDAVELERARREVAAALEQARGFAQEEPHERDLVTAQSTSYADYRRLTDAARRASLERFFDANGDYRADIDGDRQAAE